jgi:cystathionine beta-lyase
MTGGFDDVHIDALRRRRTVKWSLHGPDVLAAWVAEMDFDVAPPIRTALLDAIDRQDFGYIPADVSELATACSSFLSRVHGWEVPATRIFLVADVLAGLAGALDQFVEPDVPIILPTPSYPPLFEIIELGGRRVVPVPLLDDGDRFTLDLDAIDGAFAAGARALLLCNPHNPTGRVFTRYELTAVSDIVDRHDARVICDEVHAPLVHPGHRHLPYAALSEMSAGHTVTVTSTSKGWNIPGLKCAQVLVTNHDDAARWRKLPEFAVPGPTPLGIAASTAAYTDGVGWLRDLLDHLDGNRQMFGELIERELPGVSWYEPEGTYLAWLDCRSLGVDDPASFFLRQARVAVNDGPPFGEGYERFVRLNLATSRSLLGRIVGRMGEAISRSR